MKLYLAVALSFCAMFPSAQAQTAAAYQAYVNSLSPSYYFTLDNTLTDSVGASVSFTPNGSTGAFASDYWGNASGSRLYHGGSDGLSTGTDLINGGGPNAGNSSASGVGSLTIMFESLNNRDTSTGQRFIFAQGAVTSSSPVTNNAFALFMDNNAATDPSALRLRAGNTTTTIMTSNNIVPSTWYYFGVTWDETRNTGELKWYVGPVGGTLTSGTFNINDASVVGNDGTFYLGNKDAAFGNGYRLPTSDGSTDELALWSRELSSTEINGAFSAITAAPEPSSLGLGSLGLFAAAMLRRDRK
jgi:Concanavalin A-like lectin/glucanases superfamily/PEP-CTERM motif